MAIGCGPSAVAQPAADTAGSTGPVGSTTVVLTDTAGTTAGMADGSTTDSDFIEAPDHLADWCDPWAQECPPGQKCAWVASDGGTGLDIPKCVPAVDDPNGVGERCASRGRGTGLDDCEVGALCWDLDEDNLGTCIGYCTNPNDPSCAERGTTCILGSRGPALCLPTCHPLQDDCPAGDLCIPNDDKFLCVLDADPDNALGPGDDCGFANVCDAGHLCGNPAANPLCDPAAPGCCIPFCDLTAPDCPGAECVPWYDPLSVPDGYENLGACVVPR